VDELILASSSCDTSADIICAPENVLELFKFEHPFFSIGPLDFTRTVILIFLAMAIVIAILYMGLRGNRVIPTKFGAAVESLVTFVKDEIATGIIGPEGARYTPYLLSVFMLVLVGNLFEVTPLINFPITSSMALPLIIAVLTWLIFVSVGFAKNGLSYFVDTVWPKSVPIALRPLVGLIELVSIFVLRPITLAVRLFANMVAGHLMLTLLLASGVIFIGDIADIGARSIIGVPWFVFGLGIFVFEIVVAVLQAYIITLLSAVYVQTSVHPEH
jgi:F-type H+-transporting ATPase subunit a